MTPQRTCSLDDCARKHYGHGYCGKHYLRWRNHGDPMGGGVHYATPELAFVNRVMPDGACLIWTGTLQNDGYGNLQVNGRKMLAHRYAWERVHGPIPRGFHIDHRCHRPACVAMHHLRLATNKQNLENRKGPTKRTKSGVLGVCWDKAKGKWLAQVKHDGKHVLFKRFDHLQDAADAVRETRLHYFTHNDRDRIGAKP